MSVYGLRLLAQPRIQRAALIVGLATVLGYRLVQLLEWAREIAWGYDFSFYWIAARNLLNGQPIYSAVQLAGPYAPQGQQGFLYPPPFAAVAIPFAVVFPTDYRVAEWGWTAIGLVIVAASVLALSRSERLAERYPLLAGRGRWFLVAAAFAYPPVVAELVIGNVHILLLGLLTLGWLGIRRDDATGERLAGIAIGLATVIKVFPGVLVLWFLLTRRWTAALWALIGAAVFTLVTLPITGIEPWLQYPTVLGNLSAPRDPADTLAPTVWLAPLIGFTVARILITVAGLAIVVATSSWAIRGRAHPSLVDSRTPVSFAISVMVSVLIAPAVYQHYLAILVLPFVLALGAGVSLPWLGLAYFLMWGGRQPALGQLAWVLNRALPTLGALALLAALLAHRLGARRLPVTLPVDADVRGAQPGQPDDRPARIQ